MQDDLSTGAAVEDSPLAEALEIQQKRVCDTVEVAVLQAINDVRNNFKDLSEENETFFEARLQGEILGDALSRYQDLMNKLLQEEDVRGTALRHVLAERLSEVLEKLTDDDG